MQTKKVVPVHWCKFQLANHAWDEPIINISQLAQQNKLALITPMIGETVYFKNEEQQFKQWWLHIK